MSFNWSNWAVKYLEILNLRFKYGLIANTIGGKHAAIFSTVFLRNLTFSILKYMGPLFKSLKMRVS